MRIPLLALFLFCISFQSIGQNVNVKAIDSLQQALVKAQDSTRVDILNNLATLYYNIDMKKSLGLGEEALNLATHLTYYRGIQNAHSILRRIHRRLGNYSVSIEYTLKNLPISERLGDTLELLDSYTILGNIHSSMENFSEAQKYLMQALSIGKKIDSPNLANILNYIGRSYGKMGHYDSGQYYIQAALLRETEVPQPGYGLSYIYNNLAEIHYFKKEYKKSIEFYSLSAHLPEEKRSEYGLTFTLNGLALVYKELKKYDAAITHALESIAIAKKNTFRDKTKEAYGILYEVYQEKKDFKQALDYYKQFNLYQDSIFSEDRIQYIDNLKITYETEKMTRENELLRKDAELINSRVRQQFILVWVSIATITFLSVILILLFRNNKQRKKSNALLKEYSIDLQKQVDDRTQDLVKSNIELVKQNNQLEQFGYIIAHNLRGPVARILGLSNLITTHHFDVNRDQELIRQLHVSAEELDTIIYDLNAILDIKKGIHNSYEEINLSERLEKIKSILKDNIKESNTKIVTDLQVHTCYAIPAYIESILYNLISNAIKYRSFDRAPVISIMSSPEGNRILFTIQDNGIGLDLGKLKEKVFTLYQRFHHHVEGKGLGLFLVKTQVEALNGSIEVESKVGQGTLFKISLPIKHEIPQAATS